MPDTEIETGEQKRATGEAAVRARMLPKLEQNEMCIKLSDFTVQLLLNSRLLILFRISLCSLLGEQGAGKISASPGLRYSRTP